MEKRYCPECGHEIVDRGRFCQFCGCDLRKTPAKPSPDSRSEAPSQSIQHAPQSTQAPRDAQSSPGTQPYRNSLSLRTVFLIMLITAACAFAVVMIVRNSTGGKDPTLRYGMTFREAAAEMKRCGFVPDGEPTEKNGITTQNYKEHTLYDTKARWISLEAVKDKGGRVSLSAFYQNGKGAQTKDMNYWSLKSYLTSKHGKAEKKSAVYEYLRWELKDGYIVLMDAGDMVMAGETHDE